MSEGRGSVYACPRLANFSASRSEFTSLIMRHRTCTRTTRVAGSWSNLRTAPFFAVDCHLRSNSASCNGWVDTEVNWTTLGYRPSSRYLHHIFLTREAEAQWP